MPEEIFHLIEQNVSRETFLMLQEFVQILLKWNKKINLVSKQTNEKEIWRDHIMDSIVLAEHIIQKDELLVDVGSGAGFPGLILAMMQYQNVVLVEINSKKSAFLNFIASEFNLKCRVKNQDIKALAGCGPRYITSRAMASISEIIKMTAEVMTPYTEYLFHVGEAGIRSELVILRQTKSFELQEWQNPYKDKCRIISIKNIKDSGI